MEDIFLNKDEETQNVDGCIVNTPEETPDSPFDQEASAPQEAAVPSEDH